jgi:hypothetical protein
VAQIAAISGHALKDVESILQTHYLGGGVELAEAAIVKLNAVYDRERNLQAACKPRIPFSFRGWLSY